ncbi:hypothetical protein A2T55_02110 [Brevibacterium linens]|uniref:Uncharacterized protein n=1 Tax=Brevibacterium linens TaxID=1703 RepID=A0A144M6X8_BRELN|nr:hypothetical protein [Brevibacterium linens]AMT92739.1 hypothetical protein A2T55_02110 [Brevibacterium linens]
MYEEEIDRFYDRHGITPECDTGWFPIIFNLDDKITAIDPNYKAEQVKEKFGALRFYYDTMTVSSDDWVAIDELVDSAEELSRATCEVCGATDSTVSQRTQNRWIKTLCETHAG